MGLGIDALVRKTNETVLFIARKGATEIVRSQRSARLLGPTWGCLGVEQKRSCGGEVSCNLRCDGDDLPVVS